MEAQDCNTLAADCLVISCCCQCFILQLIIFIFINLPYKLLQKTRRYAKRKLARTKKQDHHNKAIMIVNQINRQPPETFHDHCFCCMEEVERVLEEMSQKGLFGFGSFWHGDDDKLSSEELLLTCFDRQCHHGSSASILIIGDT